jgi:hypothetical protein
MLLYLQLTVIEKTESFESLRKELNDGIVVLEEFAKNIDHFVAWWNWMKMEAITQETRTEAIHIDHNSLREESVIGKWREFKGQYAAYTNKV